MDMFKKDLVVAVKVDGSIMRETGDEHNEIMIPFGCEYSLLFKNMRTQRVAVSVEIDGQDVLNGRRIAINGGETGELERFVSDLNKGNKFRFIQKTSGIQAHRGDRIDDGLIRIVFQYEKPYVPVERLSLSRSVVRGQSASMSVPNSAKPMLDEGITVKGSDSNQQFRMTTMGEMEKETYSMVFKLRGYDDNQKAITKPLTVTAVLECTTCGRKSKSNSRFCSNCGTHL